MNDKIKEIITAEIDSGVLQGASLCVWKNDAVQFRMDFGVSNLTTQTPLPSDAIFRLYSASKPITATAAMLLIERNQLNLSDPVSKYLDGFKNQKVYENGKLVAATQEVTVRDLLNMTAGLVYPDCDDAGKEMTALFDSEIALGLAGKGHSTVDFCNAIGQVPLAFQPGTTWRYGTSADVLGAVIEVASGKPFRQFLHEELFEPLGMTDTDFFVPEAKRDRFVQMVEYCEAEQKLVPYPGSNLAVFDATENPAFSSGGAGLFSTVQDYGKFASMLLQNGIFGGKRFLREDTVAFMRSNGLNEEQKKAFDWPHLKGYGYGNLMRVMLTPTEASFPCSEGEFGWDGWAGVYVAIDPVENLVITYFISRIGYDCQGMRCALREAIHTDFVAQQ